jgi:16S rRNA processing protein RimM
MDPQRRILVGAIAGAHGVRGLVRLKSFTADPRAIAGYGPLCDERGTRRLELALVGSAKDALLVRIAGIDSREAAEALRGLRLYVDRAQLPPPADPEEFYVADLIGLGAETSDGAPLGRIASVENYGAGDIVEIVRPDGGTLLVPFSRQAVPVIDLAGGRVVIDPPPETAAAPPGAGGEGD